MIEVLSISKSYYEAAKRPPSLFITSYCSIRAEIEKARDLFHFRARACRRILFCILDFSLHRLYALPYCSSFSSRVTSLVRPLPRFSRPTMNS